MSPWMCACLSLGDTSVGRSLLLLEGPRAPILPGTCGSTFLWGDLEGPTRCQEIHVGAQELPEGSLLVPLRSPETLRGPGVPLRG